MKNIDSYTLDREELTTIYNQDIDIFINTILRENIINETQIEEYLDEKPR